MLKALPPPAKAVKIVATVMALGGYLQQGKLAKRDVSPQRFTHLTLPAQEKSYQLKKVLLIYNYIYIRTRVYIYRYI